MKKELLEGFQDIMDEFHKLHNELLDLVELSETNKIDKTLDDLRREFQSWQSEKLKYKVSKRTKREKKPNEDRRKFLNELEKRVNETLEGLQGGNKYFDFMYDDSTGVYYGLYANTNSLKSKIVKAVRHTHDVNNELIAKAVILEKLFDKQLLPKDIPQPTHFVKGMVVTHEWSNPVMVDTLIGRTLDGYLGKYITVDDTEVDYNET